MVKMAKKFIAVLIMIMLSITVNSTFVYASNPIDGLENRGETESVAGITWDQINEMSQNSPNSLTPIQGLVLWMFVILAFLKLAQKMDTLLQSLGLNVTQTGGRAVGDLIMAGMALKNIGGMMSKGMGMFGFGGKGGGSGGGTSGTGTGTSSAGGTGPAPIPAGSRRSSPTPQTGTNPGATSLGGHTSPSSTSSSTTPTSSTTTPTSSVAPSDLPRNTTTPSAPSSASTSRSSSTSASSTDGGTSGTTGTASNRNPIGKAVDWMKGDGFAQGAIKAGAKGGLIGVGVYTAKAGASKIGSAVSAARLGDKGIFSAPKGDWTLDNDGIAPNSQPTNDNTTANSTKNPEEYQESRPLDGTEDASTIPTSSNSEEYQDTKPSDTADETGSVYSSVNDEEYNETSPHDTSVDTPPISTTINGEGSQDSDSASSISDDSESEQVSSTSDKNDEQWNDTTPTGIQTGSAPIPTAVNAANAVNNEGWQSSNPTDNQPTPAVDSASKVPPVAPQADEVPNPISANKEGWQDSDPTGKQSAAVVDSIAKTPPTQQSNVIPVAPPNASGEQWQDTKPTETPKKSGAMPIPAAVNKEGWQDSNPLGSQSSATADSVSRVATTPANAVPIAPSQQESGENSAVTPIAQSQPEGATAQNSGTLPQTGATITATSADSSQFQQGVGVPAQSDVAPQLESSDKSPSAVSAVQQDISANISSSTDTETSATLSGSVSTETSIISSENVSAVHEYVPAHEGDAGHSVTQDNTSSINESKPESYESAPMPLHNSAISGGVPQNTAPAGVSHETPVNDSAGVGIPTSDTVSHTPIHADNTAASTSIGSDVTMTTTTPQSETVNPTQPQVVSETFRTELPVTAQMQGNSLSVVGESASSVQTNTIVQPQTTNINNTTKPDTPTSIQPTAQPPTTQVIQVEKQGYGEQPTTPKGDTPTRPTTKGKSKNPAVKGRRRKG